MKRNGIVFLCLSLVAALWIAGGPILAHHGFYGVFDLNHSTTFQGIVTKAEWRNPHISIFVDVKDEKGKVTNWRFEGAAPSAMRLRGYNRGDLKAGDRVIVEAHCAKNGMPIAAASVVVLPDSRKMPVHSDGVLAPIS